VEIKLEMGNILDQSGSHSTMNKRSTISSGNPQ